MREQFGVCERSKAPVTNNAQELEHQAPTKQAAACVGELGEITSVSEKSDRSRTAEQLAWTSHALRSAPFLLLTLRHDGGA